MIPEVVVLNEIPEKRVPKRLSGLPIAAMSESRKALYFSYALSFLLANKSRHPAGFTEKS
jgi:hypothetical protein